MSQRSDDPNPFDPFGAMRTMRDANMDAWSKMMQQFVNTEAYAQTTGAILDAYLTSSAPFRKAIEQTMTQVLTQYNMPTRTDVTGLAERLTNIEMRLDDLDAQLSSMQHAASQTQPQVSRAAQESGTPGHSRSLLARTYEDTNLAPTHEDTNLATPTTESETAQATTAMDPVVEQISEPESGGTVIRAGSGRRGRSKENQ